MKKKIALLIAAVLIIPSIAFAVVSNPPPLPSCSPPSSSNHRPVTSIDLPPGGEDALKGILIREGWPGSVDVIADQQSAGMWSFSYSAISGNHITIKLAGINAGYRFNSVFGIWSCNGSGAQPSQVPIFRGYDYPKIPNNVQATLWWDSSGNLHVEGDPLYVYQTSTGTGISPCSFGFFLENDVDGGGFIYYTVDSLNIGDGGKAHALAYKSFDPNTNKWAIAFEDTLLGGGDDDYNDLVVIVDSLNPEQPDTDGDGICDVFDNCPKTPNGPLLGTCLDIGKSTCSSDDECDDVSCSKDQGDYNDDGLGDACSGGPDTKYTLYVPPKPVLMSDINLTTTFVNDTGEDIVTIRPDCIGNTTFTVTDSGGNRVDPLDLIRTAYGIGQPYAPKSDVIIIKQGESFDLPCNLAELFPSEAEILVPGDYTVQSTYSQNLPPVGGIDLSMLAIRSTPQTITVYSNYTFAGFFAPVDNPPVLNTAKAGQAIPVKWQLKDSKGVGIDDPSSFVSLTSFWVNCGTFTGNPSDAVPVGTPGSSTLQYLGDGKWQYNWKTLKSYATAPNGPCRTMVLKLKDGTTHNANFKFK